MTDKTTQALEYLKEFKHCLVELADKDNRNVSPEAEEKMAFIEAALEAQGGDVERPYLVKHAIEHMKIMPAASRWLWR